ncbi:MAG: outer membrane channel protein TolC [Candidatus Pelagadaptatus aseana]|uniref:TolC family outer membrane protein n=1 Tax=Candidatus Pelagadaptatus aseana TaxID=3120508 RepID=UPI0039B271F4
MKWLVNGLAAGALLIGHSAGAENLLQILDKAKLADPQFLGAGFEREAVGESVKQARARLLPGITYSLEQMDSDQNIIQTPNDVFGSGQQDFETDTDTLTLSQSIFNYEYWMRYGQAKVARTRADFEFEKAYQDLLLRVGETYFELLKAREQLSSIAAEKKALEGHLNYAKKSFDAGLGREAEYQDARARYLSSVAQEVEYQRLYGDARYAMLEIIGHLPERLEGMQRDLPLISPEPASSEDWVNRGLESNPDVKVAQEQLQEARYEIRAQNAGHFPTLSLVIQDYTQESGGSLYGGQNEIEQQDVMLTLDVPIYQGGAVSSRKREAVKRMHKAQEDLTQVKRGVENQAQSAYHGVVANIAQIKALEQTVVAQQAVLDNRERGFQSGLYGMIAVLDAQQDLAMAQMNYITARNDYAINFIRLKRAAGVLIDADLSQVNGWLEASAK